MVKDLKSEVNRCNERNTMLEDEIRVLKTTLARTAELLDQSRIRLKQIRTPAQATSKEAQELSPPPAKRRKYSPTQSPVAPSPVQPSHQDEDEGSSTLRPISVDQDVMNPVFGDSPPAPRLKISEFFHKSPSTTPQKGTPDSPDATQLPAGFHASKKAVTPSTNKPLRSLSQDTIFPSTPPPKTPMSAGMFPHVEVVRKQAERELLPGYVIIYFTS